MNTSVNNLIMQLRQISIPILRICLGLVFLWFGLLKILGVSPVVKMIESTYRSFPEPAFLIFLGILEVIIGLGLILKVNLKLTLLLFILQMGGTFTAMLLAPNLFFDHNIFLLTYDGEFVIKNLVFISAGLVIAGHEISDKKST